jgi:hypothetical protein
MVHSPTLMLAQIHFSYGRDEISLRPVPSASFALAMLPLCTSLLRQSLKLGQFGRMRAAARLPSL